MRIISKTRLKEFWKKHSESKGVMEAWHQVARKCTALSLNELKDTFSTADYVAGKYIVFNIGGNKYRLVAVIHYDAQRMYIRGVFTHAEYDKWTKEHRGK